MRHRRPNVIIDDEDLEAESSTSSSDDDDEFLDVINGGVQRVDPEFATTNGIATHNTNVAISKEIKSSNKEDDILEQIKNLSLGPPSQEPLATPEPTGIFAKLKSQQNPLVKPRPHQIPVTHQAKKSHNTSASFQKQSETSQTFGSPIKSFNASNGSFLEPMTPSSRKWGQKFDISKFREEVPINPMTSKMVEAKKRPQSVFEQPVMPVNSAADVSQTATDVQGALDYMDYNEEEFMGTEDVKGLEVKLLEHQIRGLAFLRSREAGEVTAKGGLLCDDMGLGKTIQSISLILSNPAPNPWLAKESGRKKATLVVAPLALIAQWEHEVDNRTGGRLKALVHHGTKRSSNHKDFDKYDVIITTYQTLNSERKMVEEKKRAPCLESGWWRIILDEAHTIKNRSALMTKATLMLSGDRKWCLTGTPVQNSIDDIFPLIAFIGIKPFNNYSAFHLQMNDTYIGRMRLRSFLTKIMVRRSKKVLGETNFKLPDKNTHLVEVELSEQEEKEYQEFEAKSRKKMRSLEWHGGRSIMQALLLLLRLRQVCCHWKLVHSTLKEDDMQALDSGARRKKKSSPGLDRDSSADDLADSLNNLKLGDANFRQIEESVLKDVDAEEELGQVETKIQSSKMIKAFEIIKSEPKRKTILFSQFTSMLDLFEPHLEQMGIKFVRYDGSMTPQNREKSLRALREDEDVPLLLCSLKCGALGLNLTVANRVILFDPWWNPMIMDQAVDRVHRMGQTKIVDVYQLMVVRSVEERIYDLQRAKRELASSVLDKGSLSQSGNANKLDREEIFALFDM